MTYNESRPGQQTRGGYFSDPEGPLTHEGDNRMPTNPDLTKVER